MENNCGTCSFIDNSKQGMLEGDIPEESNLLRPWVLGFSPTWDPDGKKMSFTRFKLGHHKSIDEILRNPKLVDHLEKSFNNLEKDEIQLSEREFIGFLLGPVSNCHTLDSVHNILKNNKIMTSNKIQFYLQTNIHVSRKT